MAPITYTILFRGPVVFEVLEGEFTGKRFHYEWNPADEYPTIVEEDKGE